MSTYAALGIASALFSMSLSYSLRYGQLNRTYDFDFPFSLWISLASLTAALRLFTTALMAVLRSPISFFDTTPMGTFH